ncbi:GumC family protein [Rhizobium oryziradicis]|nr:GumC family protein [Rhizobium oryziradicis]
MDIDIFQIPGILRRRWQYLAIGAVVFAALALVYALSLKPVYISSTQILLDPRGLSASASDSRPSGTSVQVDPASLDSQIYVVLSSAVLTEVINRLDLTQDPFFKAPQPSALVDKDTILDATMAALIKHIKVEREGQSLIMSITVDHPVAKSAADIANMVATVYLKQLDEARADAARRASNAFQAQASELRDRVRKAETAVETFRSANGLANTGSTGLVIDQQLAGLNQQLIAARGVEEQQQSIYDQTRNLTLSAVQAGGIPEAVQSSTMGLLRDRYVQLLDRQAEAQTSLGANHPQLKAINSQVAAMQRAIQQELDRLRQSVKASYERAVANRQSLEERLKSLTQSSFDSGARQIKLRQLESEADAVRTIYKAFLNRAEELSQEQTISINNSRIITPAIAVKKSVTVLKIMILVAATLFGLAFGSALAILREMLSSHRSTPQQALAQPAQPRDTPQPQAKAFTAPDIAPAFDERPIKADGPPPPPALAISDIPIIADGRAQIRPERSSPMTWIKAIGKRFVSPIASTDGTLRTKPTGHFTPDHPAPNRLAYDHAVASTTRFLLDCGEGHGRISIAFIAAGHPAASAFIGDVVQKLIDRDRGVLLASGALQSLRSSARATSSAAKGRPSLITALHQVDGDDAPYAPLPQTLRYERLSLPRTQSVQTRPTSASSTPYARPTYSRFVEKNQQQLTDFIIINACGTEPALHQQAIAAETDIILLLTTDHTADVAAAFDQNLKTLGDDAHKILGRILLEAA